MLDLKLLKKHRLQQGWLSFYIHLSYLTGTKMKFSIYLPDQVKNKMPALFWLSGLTCTEENFVIKSGFARKASELGLAVICPDTSPRETSHPGENDSYDFGSGAGFYVNATEEPWAQNYQMYDYVSQELPKLILQNFPIHENQIGISGHSMGGHGALVLGIRNQGLFKSISAFSPIVAPSQAPWGVKAFKGYLGENRSNWAQYDACELIKDNQFQGKILIHQGLSDEFLDEQLKPHLLQEAAKKTAKSVQIDLIEVENFDHSYYFISSFIDDHLDFHFKNITDYQ